jgi:hypothetical protein
MVFRRQNTPTFRIVWNKPIRIQRPLQPEKLPVYNLMSELFYTPVFHFRLRQEIIKDLVLLEGRLDSFKGLFPIDIVFSNTGFEMLKHYYSQYRGDESLKELGRWLTEQVTAVFLDQAKNNRHIPEIFIRCCVEKKDNDPELLNEPSWRNPYQLVGDWISRHSTQLDAPNQRPYRFIFSKSGERTPNAVMFDDLIAPNHPKLHWFEKGFPPNDLHLIPPRVSDLNIFPLVDWEQVRLSLVTFPSNDQNLLFAQHVGRHESWVYNGPDDENITEMDGWVNIPRDGWMPIYPGNILVLGRIAKMATGARIVPGSMLIRVEYDDKGETYGQ